MSLHNKAAAASLLASALLGSVGAAAEPPPDPPQTSTALFSSGAVVTVAGAMALGVVVFDDLTFIGGSDKLLTHDQSIPLLWGSLGVMGAGTAMLLVGRERDYGVEVPRRSSLLAGIGVGATMVGAAMLGTATAFAGTDQGARSFGDPVVPQERWNYSSVTTFVTIGGVALFGGGYAMFLVGSAQAPQKAGIEVSSARTPALHLGLPTLSVAPLYTQRELSRYGLAQGTEVRLDLLRGAF